MNLPERIYQAGVRVGEVFSGGKAPDEVKTARIPPKAVVRSLASMIAVIAAVVAWLHFSR